jgi:hypothetical protein
LCIEIAQRGYRKNEPAGAPLEMSLVLRKVFQALRTEGISKVDVARDLNCNPEDLDKTIFGLVVTGLPGGGGRRGQAAPKDVTGGRSIHLVK